jgi:NADH oxidoreductase Hcr
LASGAHAQVPDLQACTAYMCGPEPFMAAVEEELRSLRFPLGRLHRESFAF